MMILYLSSNVYMVGQKGMWWKYNFVLVQMRGDIATKQLGRLIRFLYPHFIVISYAYSPNHEGLMAPSGNASMRCPVGRAGAAPLHRPQCTKSMVFCGVRPPQRPGETSGFTMFLASDAMSCYTLGECPCDIQVTHGTLCTRVWVVQCTMYPVLVWFHGVRRPL